MDVTPMIPADRQVITGYGKGRFRINDATWEQPVLVLPGKVLVWDLAELDADCLDALAEAADPMPEMVLLGTGATMEFVPPKLRSAWSDKGLKVDVMDTGAACRTWNVLLAEGRRVAAALIPV
ncbi:MAG: Mth938-like domain-containing protein [Alphaproteobacteria bacterium]